MKHTHFDVKEWVGDRGTDIAYIYLDFGSVFILDLNEKDIGLIMLGPCTTVNQ